MKNYRRPSQLVTLALALFAFIFAGCAGSSNYTTAKVPEAGHIEISPYYTKYYFFDLIDFEESTSDAKGNHSLGFSGYLGTGFRTGLGLRMEKVSIDNLRDDVFMRVEAKHMLEDKVNAVSIGYGQYRYSTNKQITLRGYFNHYQRDDFYFCLSPYLTFVTFDINSSSRGYFFPFGLTGSMTYEMNRFLFLRTEVGAGSFRVLHAGLSGGLNI